MKLIYKTGSSSQLQRIIIQSSATGNPLTGLTYGSSGLKWSYIREDQTTVTQVTPVAGTMGTWVSGGFVEVDSTNFPGLYEIGLPNASLASSVSVQHTLFGATNMLPVALEIQLTAVDLQDGVHFALTSLPNAAAGANGGLPLSNASGNVGADLQTVKTQAVTAAAPVTVLASVGTAAPSTAQSGDLFGVVNPMITNHVYTAPALANAPTGGGGGGNVNVTEIGGVAVTAPGSGTIAFGNTVSAYTGADTSGTTTLLAKIGTPAGGSVSADIATANAGISTANTGITNLAAGNGLFVPGTISTATSASSIIVQFTGSAPPAAGLPGLFCCITSTAHSPEKQQITTATVVDSTHLTLTFLTAFGVAPSNGDSVLIG